MLKGNRVHFNENHSGTTKAVAANIIEPIMGLWLVHEVLRHHGCIWWCTILVCAGLNKILCRSCTHVWILMALR